MTGRNGPSIIVIGVLHTAFGLWRFAAPLGAMLRDGLVNTVHPGALRDPGRDALASQLQATMVERGFATWFLYAGWAFGRRREALVEHREAGGLVIGDRVASVSDRFVGTRPHGPRRER